MTTDSIGEFLSKFIQTLSLEELVFIQSKLQKVEFKKGDVILKINEKEEYLSFLQKGVVRYFIPKEEKNITVKIIFENDFVSSYGSLVKRDSSKFAVEALSDLVMWRISYDDLQDIFKETQNGNYLGRIVLEFIYLEKSEREISFLTDSAEERYLKLLKGHKHLIQHIPLKYIASFIGITPQALSRIRARIN